MRRIAPHILGKPKTASYGSGIAMLKASVQSVREIACFSDSTSFYPGIFSRGTDMKCVSPVQPLGIGCCHPYLRPRTKHNNKSILLQARHLPCKLCIETRPNERGAAAAAQPVLTNELARQQAQAKPGHHCHQDLNLDPMGRPNLGNQNTHPHLAKPIPKQ